jgi:sugar/nucleoside kinase (ribokinase family)
MKTVIYGIGNPLIDILVKIEEQDIANLGLDKGIMKLLDQKEREKIVNYLKLKEKSYSCGGSCPNTIITLSALGIKAALGGKICKDEFGDIYKARLESQKNIIADLKTDALLPTGSSIILITPDSERTMNTFLGANREFRETDVNESFFSEINFFYFTGYMWDTESQKAAVKKCLDICKKKKVKVAFDVADPFAVKRYKTDFLKIIEQNADFIFANHEEANELFDRADPEKAAEIITKMGKTAAIKWGKHGSIIKSPSNNLIKIPVLNDKGRADTTGAGDTYAAGFLYGLCTNKNLEISGKIASILASAIVAKTGAQFTLEEITEIKKVIDKL